MNRPMRIVVAPGSFKGSLSSVDAAVAIERGARRGAPGAEISVVPMADGGKGTVAVVQRALGGTLRTRRVSGPLGDKVEASYLYLAERAMAVIEMAAASGLELVPAGRCDPLRATSYGTGELLLHAIEQGCRRVVVGIGDTATVDGGAGIAQACGIHLLDDSEKQIGPGGGALSDLAKIARDSQTCEPIWKTTIQVAVDVQNPLLGPSGAARVFAPQKGATPEQAALLENNLGHFAWIIRRDLGFDVSAAPGSGAGGGAPAGIVALLGGEIISGFDFVAETTALTELIEKADLVLTGEGRLDRQSAGGKVTAGVVRLAAASKVPVVVICGQRAEGWEEAIDARFTRVVDLTEAAGGEQEAMANAATWIERLAAQAVKASATALNH